MSAIQILGRLVAGETYRLTGHDFQNRSIDLPVTVIEPSTQPTVELLGSTARLVAANDHVSVSHINPITGGTLTPPVLIFNPTIEPYA